MNMPLNRSFLSITLLLLSSNALLSADKQTDTSPCNKNSNQGKLNQFFPLTSQTGLNAASQITFGSFNQTSQTSKATAEEQEQFSHHATPRPSRAPSPTPTAVQTASEDVVKAEDDRKKTCLEALREYSLPTGRSEQSYTAKLFFGQHSERVKLLNLMTSVEKEDREFDADVDTTTCNYGINDILNNLKPTPNINTIAEQTVEYARISQCLDDLQAALLFAEKHSIKLPAAVKIAAAAEIESINARQELRTCINTVANRISKCLTLQVLAKNNNAQHGGKNSIFDKYIGKLNEPLSSVVPAIEVTNTAHRDVLVTGFSHADDLNAIEERIFNMAIAQFATQSESNSQS